MSPDRESKPGDEPRIILSEKKADEGWKEKAKKEKEKLRDRAGGGASDSALTTRYATDPLMGGTGLNVTFVTLEVEA